MAVREPSAVRKPRWLTKKICAGHTFRAVAGLVDSSRLHTVCEEARCPNLGECFSRGTATFLILGDVCTRSCRFCAVSGGVPEPPDSGEPERVAEAVRTLRLRYAVITSVTRDDLPDGGAGHFAATIAAIRGIPECPGVEVLVPDFLGDSVSVHTVLESHPDVFNHNIETVPRLYDAVRPEADYRRSLDVLGMAGKVFPQNRVKSGLMLGLGETVEEVRAVLGDLLGAGCGLLTIGQYLAPSRAHHPVARFVPPEEFERWREEALGMGFTAVASGPYVRSSYRAEYLWHLDTDTDTDADTPIKK